MAVPVHLKRVFLRRLYNEATTAVARKAFLDDWITPALDNLANASILTGAGANGHSTSRQLLLSLSPYDATELVDWAYGFVDYDTIDDALAEIGPRAVYVSTDFSGGPS